MTTIYEQRVNYNILNTMMLRIGYLYAILFSINVIGVMASTHVFTFPHAKSLVYDDAVHSPYVFVTTPSTELVLVTIRLSDKSYDNSSMISATVYANFTLPISAILGDSTGTFDKTVIVTSEADIMVYGMCEERQSSDGFSVLPVDQLDEEYYVVSYTPVGPRDPNGDGTTPYSEVSVSAVGEETQVTMTNLGGVNLASVTLQGYESYQLLSEQDLTGVKITATNPVSVMAGSNCAWVPYTEYENLKWSGNCGYVMENIPGTNGLGQEFVLAPFEGRMLGYVYRIIASADTTSVTIKSSVGDSSFTLNSQEFNEGSVVSSEVIVIETTKAVLVAQYSKDRHTEEELQTEVGNPSMVIVPPTSQYKTAANIPVTSLSTAKPQTTYINVIANCAQRDEVTLPTQTTVSYTSADGKFCVLSGSLASPALYTINIPSPGVFAVQVYGFARYAAYSYQVPGYNPVTGNDATTARPDATDAMAPSTAAAVNPQVTDAPSTTSKVTFNPVVTGFPMVPTFPGGMTQATEEPLQGTDGIVSTTKQPVTDGSGSLITNPLLIMCVFLFRWLICLIYY